MDYPYIMAPIIIACLRLLHHEHAGVLADRAVAAALRDKCTVLTLARCAGKYSCARRVIHTSQVSSFHASPSDHGSPCEVPSGLAAKQPTYIHWSFIGVTARAENHRFWLLSALHAHTKAP